MSSEWPKVKLSDYCDKIGSGSTPRGGSKVYLDEGEISLVRSQNVYNHGFEYDGLVYIDEKAAEKLSNVELKENDVLINITGDSVARVCMVPDDVLPARVNQHVSILRPKENALDPRFLRYSLVNYENQYKLLAIASAGGTRKAITKGHLEEFEIDLPDLAYQKEVSEILSVFDQKIHLNRQTNETLEAMAHAIFKSWFVDFDPVCAKIEAASAGRDPNRAAMAAIAGISSFAKASEDKSSSRDWDEVEAALDQKLTRMSDAQQHQLTLAAELFPDELVECEIGEVPKGWDYSTIGKEFDIVNGQSPPGSSYNEEGEGAPFYQGRTDFGFRFPTQRVYCTEPKRFAKKGDTLLSVRAPVGDLNIAIEDCCIGRGLASLRHKSSSISYTYYAMKQIQAQIEAYEATGTVFGSINQKQLKALDTISPDDKIINEFHRVAEPIDGQIMNQVFMNRELSELRDSLLPKLISGEVEV